MNPFPYLFPIKGFIMRAQGRKDLFIGIAVFLISLTIFGLIIHFDIQTDIQKHAESIVNTVDGTEPLPPNILYYLTVYALSFFQTNMTILLGASVFVLSLAVTLKFMLTKKLCRNYLTSSGTRIGHLDRLIALASFLLIFVFSLPATTITLYIGQTPPNVWHNSTTIFLMPLALLLFWTSYQQLVDPQNRRIWIISLLVIANILAKPNFFFVFSIVYPLLLISRIGIGKRFWLNVVPIILGVFLLGAQYYLLTHADEEAGIVISPFLVWSFWSSNIPFAIILSTIFPLTYLWFHWKEMLGNLLLKYAVSCYLVAISIYAIFAETGVRQLHANFSWQCVVCNYILFMVICILLLQKVAFNGKLGKLGTKDKVIVSSLLLHVIFGFIYLGKLFLTGNYL